MVELIHKTEFSVAHLRPLLFAQIGNIFSVNFYAAGIKGIERAQALEQSGLAAARGTHNRHGDAFFNF